MVGKVGDGGQTITDAEAECLTAFVRNLQRRHREALDVQCPLAECVKAPSVAQLTGTDREVRRRHPSLKRTDGIAVRRRQVYVDPGARCTSGAEEGQAVHVIPVQMS